MNAVTASNTYIRDSILFFQLGATAGGNIGKLVLLLAWRGTVVAGIAAAFRLLLRDLC